MTRSGVTLLSFAVLLAIVEIGSCTMCYQCNSQSQAECADPFNNNKITLQDCDKEQDVIKFNDAYLKPLLASVQLNVLGSKKYCHKLVTNTNTVIRVCLEDNPTNLNTTCQMIAPKVPNLKHCSVCDKDRCNGAVSLSASLSLAISALFASYMYLKQ